MLIRITRYLMNVADGSPGGGAPAAPGAPVVTPTPAPAPAPAQGAAPTIDRATEDALIKKGRDAAFAELRRNGHLKKSYVEPNDGDGAGGSNGKPATPASNDSSAYRRLDRALNRSGHAARLSDAQYGRLERAFAAETPDDADGWVKDYFDGLGAAPPAGAPPATTTTTVTPPATGATPPVTARGTPAASQVPIEEANLLKLTDDDRKALIASKGLKWFTQKYQEQLKGVRIKVGPR